MTEIKFKLKNGSWGTACFDTAKIDEIINKLSTVTEVKKVSS